MALNSEWPGESPQGINCLNAGETMSQKDGVRNSWSQLLLEPMRTCWPSTGGKILKLVHMENSVGGKSRSWCGAIT